MHISKIITVIIISLSTIATNIYCQELNNKFVNGKLDQLKEKVKNAQVVMLGEANHGQGNVMSLNIEIIKYLHEELGFNTIAFESGFYDVYKAQKNIELGGNIEKAFDMSIFPIWTKACEFQELIKYLHNKRGELEVVGFDCQLTGEFSMYESIDDLEDILSANNLDNNINFDLLSNAFLSFGERFEFPKTINYNEFTKELAKVNKRLSVLQNKGSLKDANIWLQFVKSTKELAKDYYNNTPAQIKKEDWKAFNNNPRDAQMADNLLFYLNENPNKKVICWGASSHFANNFSSTNNEELKQFIPMGSYIKQKLGNKLISIAHITASGTFGIFKTENNVPKSPINSIEYVLNKKESFYQFVDLENNKTNDVFISSAIEFTPIEAKWNNIFDAFLFIKEINPSTFINDSCSFVSENNIAENKQSENKKLSIAGLLLSDKNKPVQYCNISIQNSTIGSVSNQSGKFQIDYPKETIIDTLVFSCVGYEEHRIAIEDIKDTIILESKDIPINEVVVNAKNLDPSAIIKKAIENIPNNYTQNSYNVEFYSRGTVTNYNDLKVENERVTKIFDINGYNNSEDIHAKYVAYKCNLDTMKWESSFVRYEARGYNDFNKIDLVSSSPLFSIHNLKRFKYKLLGTTEYNNQNVYKISFVSKRKSEQYVGRRYIDDFTGTIYINKKDYSIVKVDAKWKFDIKIANAFANIFKEKEFKFNDVGEIKIDDEYINLIITYKKSYSGLYYMNVARLARIQKGQNLTTNETFELEGSQTFYTTKIITNEVEDIPDHNIMINDFNDLANDHAFWKNYTKPILSE